MLKQIIKNPTLILFNYPSAWRINNSTNGGGARNFSRFIPKNKDAFKWAPKRRAVSKIKYKKKERTIQDIKIPTKNLMSNTLALFRDLFDDKEENFFADVYKRKFINKRKFYILKKKHDILSLDQRRLLSSFENTFLFYKKVYGYFADIFDINSFWWSVAQPTIVKTSKKTCFGKKIVTQRIVSTSTLLNDFRNINDFFSQIIKFTTREDVSLLGLTFQPNYLYQRTYLKNAMIYKTEFKPIVFIKQKLITTNKYVIFIITGSDLISLTKDFNSAQKYLLHYVSNENNSNFIKNNRTSTIFINHNQNFDVEKLYKKHEHNKQFKISQKFKAYFDNEGEYSLLKISILPNRNFIFKIDLYDSNYRVSYYFAILKSLLNILSKIRQEFKLFSARDEKLVTCFIFILTQYRKLFYKIFSVTDPILLRLLGIIADTFKFTTRELLQGVAFFKAFVCFLFIIILIFVYTYSTDICFTTEQRIAETLRFIYEKFLTSPLNSSRTLYYSHLLNGSYPRQFEMADGLTNDFIQERLLSEMIKTIKDPLASSDYYSAPLGWDPICAVKNPPWIKDLSMEDVASIYLFMNFTYERFEDEPQIFFLLWSSLHPDFIEFFKNANYEEGLLAQYLIRALLMY